MQTGAERLQFVVRFVQMDLDTLRPGDWLNLRDDLGTFFSGKPGEDLRFSRGSVMISPLAHPLPYEFSEENFRDLQVESRDILSTMIAWRTPGSLRQKQIPIQKCCSVVPLDGHGLPGQNIIQIVGPTRDMFLEGLFSLLQEDTRRIMCCPECDKIFYRIRKQQYCSRQCTNRANVRHWRQRHEGKGQEADRAHSRYEKKKKAEVGQGAKVARRPRKGSTSHAETPRES